VRRVGEDGIGDSHSDDIAAEEEEEEKEGVEVGVDVGVGVGVGFDPTMAATSSKRQMQASDSQASFAICSHLNFHSGMYDAKIGFFGGLSSSRSTSL